MSEVVYKPNQLVVTKVTEPGGGVRTFDYDFKGYTFYTTDTRGNTTVYKINGDGKLLSQTVNGRTIKAVSYSSDRTETVTDESGNKTVIQRNEAYDPIRITDGEGNTTRIDYNQYWKVSRITDPLGNVTLFDYSATQDLVRVTDPAGQKILFENDPFGNVTKVTRGEGAQAAVTAYEYDSRGNAVKVTDPLGKVTNLGYDQYGHVNSVTDANGNTTQVTNDLIGRPLTIRNPLGGTKTIVYDKKGHATSIADELNRTSTFTYDFKGRVTSGADPLRNRTTFTYDGEGNLVEKRELAGTADQALTTYSYDILNRLASVTDPLNNTTSYDYSGVPGCPSCGGSASQPAKITDPLGNITRNSFNRAGKVVGVTDPLANLTAVARDAAGRPATVTDANGNATGYSYDALGRVTRQTDANNGATDFTYDDKGNLASLSDPNGNTTTFEYALAGRKTKETRPMGQATEYTYYPNGLLKTVKDAKGQVTTYGYDTANRLTEILYADGKKDSFGYDTAGNLTSYAKPGVSGAITYDELNRKLSETVNYGAFSKTFSYTYDGKGNKATFTTPEGKQYTYKYNKNNQPTAIAFDGRTIGLDYQWIRQTKQTLPNNVTTDYGYNAASWLSAITTKQNTATLASSQYGFDKVGNITAKTTEAGAYSYGYDTTYQLLNSTNSTNSETFTYDKTGNRTISGYSHNANNETQTAGAAAFTYDANGNTVTKTVNTVVTTYCYNSADRLETVQLPDGRTATYIYDPFGRRVKKDVVGVVTYFLYSDEGLIGEYDAAGVQRKGYGWKPDAIWGTDPVFLTQGESYYFYQNDHLGTPQKLVDESGVVVWSAAYTAFGQAIVNTASTVENNLRFPGQYFDEETGLHYNWNRYYDPESGRYTQVDPIGFDGMDSNVYRYVKNSTTNFIDPIGLFQSHPILRAIVPGQIAWDNAVTAFENDDYVNAILNLANMLAEQVLVALSYGSGSNIGILEKKLPCGKTVLGHYPEYVLKADKLNARRFSIPKHIWDKMTDAERWAANQKFLDRIIERGDEIILATPLGKVRPGSYYQKELEYLLSRGYRLSANRTRLIAGR